MKEILPGIYQMMLVLKDFTPGSVNTYLIRDRNGYTLVDTGWDTPLSLGSMEEQLAEHDIRLSDIKRVIFTHCHSDHLGLMERLKNINNATTYLHRNEIDIIKVRYDKENPYWPSIDRFLHSHGVPESALEKAETQLPTLDFYPEPDVLLEGGEEIPAGEYLLRIINTPGHTPGHISLYEPQKKFLISGDVLLPTIATNAAAHVMHMVNPLQQYYNSLNILKELDIDLVLPGHEYPFSNHRQRIEEIFSHYRQKSEGVLKAFNGQTRARSAYDVSKMLSWSLKTRTLMWDQLSGWDKRLAVLQAVALLEELASARLLRKIYQGDKIYYQTRQKVPH